MTVTALNPLNPLNPVNPINPTNPRYKLRLISKKLQSGKFQVKFYASDASKTPRDQELYGYVLVDAKDTLKQVVNAIKMRLHLMDEANDYYHNHLYAVRKEPPPNSEFMIFKS
ncbi:MAG: hypothetical protein OER04_16180 [Cyclobacteriaceae bacterium]|nr:hypothetical protein [Cyclobacteriaceae bacterium]